MLHFFGENYLFEMLKFEETTRYLQRKGGEKYTPKNLVSFMLEV